MLLTAVGALGALLLTLLCMPIDIKLDAEHAGKQVFRLEFGWLFGLLRRRPRPSGPPRKPKEKNRSETKRKQKRRGGPRARVVWAFLQNAGLGEVLWRLLRRLYRALHVRVEGLVLEIGLEDPADTGQLWGFVGAASGGLSYASEERIAIVPCFTAPIFAMNGSVRMRLFPGQLLGVLLMTLFSPNIFRGAWSALKEARA